MGKRHLDQLYEEFKTNPCVENRIAAIEAIRYGPLHLKDTEEYHLNSVEVLYDSAIYARANWSDEAITICESPRQHLVTKMVEANASLGEAMQDQVIFNLKSIVERADHQNVSNHARELLLKLEPEDKTSWLYSRWKFRVDTMESPIEKEPAEAN